VEKMNMRKAPSMAIVTLAMGLLLWNIPAVASDNLGSVLRESGWDRMIGTWVDAETQGKKHKSTTAWRLQDHVLESTNEDLRGGKKEVFLMGYNPKKGEPFHVSADNRGGSTWGKWTLHKDEAVLDLGYVTSGKQEGLLQLRYRLIDDDTMTVTVVLPEPIVIKMIRVKE
jgi:hypothetical protein